MPYILKLFKWYYLLAQIENMIYCSTVLEQDMPIHISLHPQPFTETHKDDFSLIYIVIHVCFHLDVVLIYPK